jgi:hypothetical protein
MLKIRLNDVIPAYWMNSPRGITEILPNEKESSLEEFLPRNPEDTRPDLSAPYARTAQKARGKNYFVT